MNTQKTIFPQIITALLGASIGQFSDTSQQETAIDGILIKRLRPRGVWQGQKPNESLAQASERLALANAANAARMRVARAKRKSQIMTLATAKLIPGDINYATVATQEDTVLSSLSGDDFQRAEKLIPNADGTFSTVGIKPLDWTPQQTKRTRVTEEIVSALTDHFPRGFSSPNGGSVVGQMVPEKVASLAYLPIPRVPRAKSAYDLSASNVARLTENEVIYRNLSRGQRSNANPTMRIHALVASAVPEPTVPGAMRLVVDKSEIRMDDTGKTKKRSVLRVFGECNGVQPFDYSVASIAANYGRNILPVPDRAPMTFAERDSSNITFSMQRNVVDPHSVSANEVTVRVRRAPKSHERIASEYPTLGPSIDRNCHDIGLAVELRSQAQYNATLGIIAPFPAAKADQKPVIKANIYRKASGWTLARADGVYSLYPNPARLWGKADVVASKLADSIADIDIAYSVEVGD